MIPQSDAEARTGYLAVSRRRTDTHGSTCRRDGHSLRTGLPCDRAVPLTSGMKSLPVVGYRTGLPNTSRTLLRSDSALRTHQKRREGYQVASVGVE